MARTKGSKDRPRPARMGREHQEKIKNSAILNRLIRHAEGKEPDVTSSEVTAGLALLKKVFPDLQPIDPNTGEGGVTLYLGDHVARL